MCDLACVFLAPPVGVYVLERARTRILCVSGTCVSVESK